MVTPIFYDGFEKSGKFDVRYDLYHDLDLDLDHEGNCEFYPILLIKMGEDFQKNLLDLHMTFKVIVEVEFKVIMTIAGHMKVRNFFCYI